LGYQPNAVARSLRLQKTSILGLILPDTHNPYFAEVIRGVEEVAFQRDYSVMLCHSGYNLEREIQYVKVLHSERVAGVLWFPATSDARPAQILAEYGIPFVILDRLVDEIPAPSVVAANFRGGYIATQHLIQLGHTVIGCIARPIDLYHSQERVRGYQAALQEHGLPCHENYIVRGGFRLEEGRLATFRLLDLQPRPTAIFAYNDFMAIGALRACYERGLNIPKDISIVGFDDIPQAAFTFPALTTIRQPKFEMGCRGAELLLEIIAGGASTITQEPPLDVHLVVRESTGIAPLV
jgi:LacI family transcriptional regulator